MATIEDFRKLDLRIGEIKEACDHPDADRLYVLQVAVGEQIKQVVAGIRGSYSKEELVGKQVVIVNNLQSALLRGVESQGMILAASHDQGIVVITPEKAIVPGAVVK